MTNELWKIEFNWIWENLWPRCRRQEKKKATQYFSKIHPNQYGLIRTAIARQKKQPSWQKDDCSFIPYFWRWLRDERWNDEVTLPDDKDWQILIEALRKYGVMPHDLPKHIADKFRRMVTLHTQSLPWPKIHDLVVNGPKIHEEQLERMWQMTE